MATPSVVTPSLFCDTARWVQVGEYSVEGNKGGASKVAVKRLKSYALRNRDIADFTAEAALMRSLTHPNIVRFRGAGFWCVQAPPPSQKT